MSNCSDSEFILDEGLIAGGGGTSKIGDSITLVPGPSVYGKPTKMFSLSTGKDSTDKICIYCKSTDEGKNYFFQFVRTSEKVCPLPEPGWKHLTCA
jgi:hypothetical protein